MLAGLTRGGASPDVGADHHVQHAEQLFARNELVAVQVVHAERELQLLFARVVARLAALADRTEDGQRLQEL